MQTFPIFVKLGLALMLGLLVGMQRERAEARLAGFRTFPLVTVLGTIAGLLAQTLGGWIVAAGLLAVVLLAVAGNVQKMREGAADAGLTTEFALALMYLVGAYLVYGPQVVAIAVGGGVAVLLQFKPELHGFVRRLEEEDLRAIMQFVLIAFIILPVLPDQTFGPFDVINPHEIWRLVVLIVGISLGGYIVYKFFGQQAGIVLGGILGGVISSTATTAGYARRSKEAPEGARAAAVVIMIASTIVYARVLLEIQVVAPRFLPVAGPRIGVMLAVSLLLCAVWWRRIPRDGAGLPEQENPAELKAAIFFGLMYALILLLVATVRHYLGNPALYLVAGISGLTDMDAITLSTSGLVHAGHLDPQRGWQMIVIAAMSNLIFKAGMVATLGHPRLLREIAVLFGFSLLSGIALLLVG